MGVPMDPEFPKRFRDKRSDRTDLVTTWREEEMLDGEVVNSFAIIFRTRGCSWSYRSGCTMCGYHTATNPGITEDNLRSQLNEALERYKGEEIVKIYTSGSFADEGEISSELASLILSSFDSRLTVVETRPEYVTDQKMKSMCSEVNELEVAIGLESSSDFVLKHCVNKGFTYQDYLTAREKIFLAGARSRTYLLLKPPFLTEIEAMDDLLNSMEAVSHPKNTISVNPVNVQKFSPLELLWKRKLYRPPWLWSLLDVLERTDQRPVISRAGLGSFRGAHNCGDCDKDVLKIITLYGTTGEIPDEIPRCSCKSEWETEKNIQSTYFRGSMEILSNRYAGYV